MSDRELLIALHDTAGRDGYATSGEVAETLGLPLNGGRKKGKGKRSPAGMVSSRFSYMARKRLVDKLDPRTQGYPTQKGTLWVMTEFGEEIMHGRIPAAVARAISSASPGDHVLIMRHLSRTACVDGTEEQATVVRREWQHNFAMRH